MNTLRFALAAVLSMTAFACAAPDPSPNDGSGEPKVDDQSEAPGPSSAAPVQQAAAPSEPAPSATTPVPSGSVPAAPPKSAARDCGMNKTASIAVKTSVVVPTSSDVFLGEGYSFGSLLGDQWVTGTPMQVSPAIDGAKASGPNLSNGAIVDALFPTLGYGDHLALRADGRSGNPIQTFADAATPNATRITFVDVAGSAEGVWQLGNAWELPSGSPYGDDQFVGIITPTRFFGVAMTVEVDNACTLQAIGDVLGTAATVSDGTILETGILDAAKRADLQKVLVRDGARVTVSVISSDDRFTVGDAIASTKCANDNLTACATLLKSLRDEVKVSADDYSDFDALQGGYDRNWIIGAYTTNDLYTVY